MPTAAAWLRWCRRPTTTAGCSSPRPAPIPALLTPVTKRSRSGCYRMSARPACIVAARTVSRRRWSQPGAATSWSPAAGSSDADDAERRTDRGRRRISAIVHPGMPIRYWDHEPGEESTRLLLLPADGGEPVDLAPAAALELERADYSISSDGSTVASSTSRPVGGPRWSDATAGNCRARSSRRTGGGSPRRRSGPRPSTCRTPSGCRYSRRTARSRGTSTSATSTRSSGPVG